MDDIATVGIALGFATSLRLIRMSTIVKAGYEKIAGTRLVAILYKLANSPRTHTDGSMEVFRRIREPGAMGLVLETTHNTGRTSLNLIAAFADLRAYTLALQCSCNNLLRSATLASPSCARGTILSASGFASR